MNGKNGLLGLAAAGLFLLSACTSTLVRSTADTANRQAATQAAPVEAKDAQPSIVVTSEAQSAAATREPAAVDLTEPVEQAAPVDLAEIHYNCQARDAVTAFLVEKYHLPKPGVWQEQPARQDTPGAQTSLYTSQAWVVKVVAPAAAPFTPEYFIVADHLGQVVRWSGVVKMNGEIVEEEYLQGEPAKQP